jgi:Outer membrane protein beta-barrel domain
MRRHAVSSMAALVGVWVAALVAALAAASVASAASAASPILAADFSLGASAGVDQGRVVCVTSFACDRRSANLKLFVGYRLNDAVEVRAVYLNAGRFKGGGTSAAGIEFGGDFKVGGFGLTAGYRWAVAPLWSVSAHAGLASVRTRFEHANPVWGSASQTTLQPLLGVGLAYAVTPALRLGIDGDTTRFKVHTTRGPLRLLGLSAQLSF